MSSFHVSHKKVIQISIITTLVAMSCSSHSASAKQDYLADASNVQSSKNEVHSDQLLELDTPSSEALRLEGEQSMRYGNYDKAIEVLKRSVQISPGDMDGRILYAEALEKKLMKQKSKDPVLYNFLLKQWLVVSKNGNFMDQKMQGRSHLMSLSGTVPKRFESDSKFLARILIPEDGSVKVALSGNRKLAAKDEESLK